MNRMACLPPGFPSIRAAATGIHRPRRTAYALHARCRTGGLMRRITRVLSAIALCVAAGLPAVVGGQGGIASAPARFLAPPDAGRRGPRGTSVRQPVRARWPPTRSSSSAAIASPRSGPSVTVPADARVIDLSSATVLPGMIDAHVHVYPPDELSQSTRTIVGGRQRAGRPRGRVHDRARHGLARRLRHGRSAQRHQPRRGDGAADAGGGAVAQSARQHVVSLVLRALPAIASPRARTPTRRGWRARRCARPSCTAWTG